MAVGVAIIVTAACAETGTRSAIDVIATVITRWIMNTLSRCLNLLMRYDTF